MTRRTRFKCMKCRMKCYLKATSQPSELPEACAYPKQAEKAKPRWFVVGEGSEFNTLSKQESMRKWRDELRRS